MPAKPSFNVKLFLEEFVIFGLVQALSIWAGLYFFSHADLAEIKITTSLWQFVIAFAIATVLMIIALRLVKGSLFFKTLFFLVNFLGAGIIFGIFLPMPVAAVLAFVWVALRFFVPRIWLHNLTIILGLGGVAAVFGLSLSIAAVLVILFVLSIYDYIAVYKTEHMVEMFRELVHRGVIFAAILPLKFKGWTADLAEIRPGGDFIFFGTGDLILPSILAVSAISYGLESVAFSVGGSFVGLVVLHILFTSQRKRAPMPALPPLVLFSALGFVISLLIK
ncbi:hypothetical protein HZB93_01835 [Candidatus Falkowbacteria bacterium]|nr:hypothetical protein [Candidatus Falkowbacteria bacterium]